MLKYLQKIHQQIKGYKKGIDTNAALWAGMPVTPALISAHEQQVAQLGQQIKNLETQLMQKMKEARTLEKQMMGVAMQVEKIAKGIHAHEPAKLAEYDMKPRKKRETRPAPGKAFIQYVKGDVDGTGFRIKMQRVENADYYEWQRIALPPGESAVAQPPFPFFKTTKKLFMVDDDVQPNFRYYYRVRGVNRAGAGAWSEPVSAVQ